MTIRRIHLGFALILALVTGFAAQAGSVDVGFSPGGSAESLVLRAIDSARKEILVAAYSFTHKDVARGLVEASRRGVYVRVVLDSSQESERYTSATYLANAGIPVRIDHEHAIMHNKYLVIDGVAVGTGSFNFTSSAARRNAENFLLLRDVPDLAGRYVSDWKEHWNHSAAYRSRN